MKKHSWSFYIQLIVIIGSLLGIVKHAEANQDISDQAYNKTQIMRLWVDHVYINLIAQSAQLDQQISCLEKNSQTPLCYPITNEIQTWQFAYQQMRLLLAMSQPEIFQESYRQPWIEKQQGSHAWPFQFTLKIRHLVGRILIPMSSNVEQPADLMPLTDAEVQMVLRLRADQFELINQKWIANQSEFQRKHPTINIQQAYWDFIKSERHSYYEEARKNYLSLMTQYPFLIFVKSSAPAPQTKAFLEAKFIQKKLLTQLRNQVWELRRQQDWQSNQPIKLLAFSYLEASFLSQNQAIESLAVEWASLKKQYERLELMEDLGYLGGLVAVGITCVVGPGKFLKILSLSKTLSAFGVGVCSIGAGLGFNFLFYDHSLSRFESTYLRILSHPNATQIRVEMTELEDREFALLLDTLFLGVGTGIGHIATKLGPKGKSLLYRILSKERTL